MTGGFPLLRVAAGCSLVRLERRSRGRDPQIRAVCECGDLTPFAGSAESAIARWREHAGIADG